MTTCMMYWECERSCVLNTIVLSWLELSAPSVSAVPTVTEPLKCVCSAMKMVPAPFGVSLLFLAVSPHPQCLHYIHVVKVS